MFAGTSPTTVLPVVVTGSSTSISITSMNNSVGGGSNNSLASTHHQLGVGGGKLLTVGGNGGGIGFDLTNQQLLASNSNVTGGNIMMAASSLSPTDDIIKMGNLRKDKKKSKRWFVLHQETYGKPARLDCYESEKIFLKCRIASSSSGASGANVHQPKSSTPMKQCFNINKRVDNKLKYCIALYTMDDVVLLGCENEQEQEAWLQTLLTVLRNTKAGFGQDESGRLNYEHVWDVNIKANSGLTEKNTQHSGPYRLCMTHTAIFLYRKGDDVHSLEFPLVFIASYGCKGKDWFLRVGRTAMTGSGELTMETEDPIIAANINDTMKSILEENHDQRQRSTSIGDRRQGSAWSGRSGSTTAATMLSSSSSVATSSTSLERSGSIVNPQSRSRAISESEKTLQSILQNTGGSSSSISSKSAMTRKTSAPPSGYMGGCGESSSMMPTSASSITSSAAGQLFFGFGGGMSSPKKAIRKMTTGSMSLRSHLSHPRGGVGVHPVVEGQATSTTAGGGGTMPGSSSTLSAASSAAVSPVSPASTSMTPGGGGGGGGGLFAGRTSSYSPASMHAQSSWMPPGQSPLTTSHAFCSSDSVGSGSTTSELDHGVSRYFHRQGATDRAASMEVVGSAIAEESSGSGAEYLPMQSSSHGQGDDQSKSTASSRASSTSTVLMFQRQPPQQQLTARSAGVGGGDTYMDMAPASTTQDRRRMTADSGYLEMHRAANTGNQPLPGSSSSDHVAGMAGYTPMGPGSVGRSSSSAHSRQQSWHLEEVRSYISDSGNSSCSGAPSRAWSLGSRPGTIAGNSSPGGGHGGGGSSGANAGGNYMAMGPAPNQHNHGAHTITSATGGPMSKFGLFLSSRLGGGSSSAEDRKRAHSVGSWNKPPWKKNLAASNLPPTDVANAAPMLMDPNAYRPRSESFGSVAARSTPGSRRLMDGGGSKLSNQSEDLVEMEFGRTSIGRSPSGSLGSTESISRSRASSLGNNAQGMNAAGGVGSNSSSNIGVGGGGGPGGRQAWSPRVEQITEDNLCLTHSPSTKLIQLFRQQLAASGGGVLSEEYVPMGPSDGKTTSSAASDDDYCAMNMGGGGHQSSMMVDSTATANRSQRQPQGQQQQQPGGGDDYVAMSIEPRQSAAAGGSSSGGRTSVTRQYSNPSQQSFDAAAGPGGGGELSTTAGAASNTKSGGGGGPVRHGSGSSNISLGNSNYMGLDSGVGGSSFSLDQQRADGGGHSTTHKTQQHQPSGVGSSSLIASEQKARSSINLSPMEQLKERLARVEMTGGIGGGGGGLTESRRSMCDEDPYMQMTMGGSGSHISSSSSTNDPRAVRRSSSFARQDSTTAGRRTTTSLSTGGTKPTTTITTPTKTTAAGNQSPGASSVRSPIFKMFSSFGKGSSSKQQQAAAAQSSGSSSSVASTFQHKSPTPSLKSIPTTSGSVDSRSRTPSASSKISLTDTPTSLTTSTTAIGGRVSQPPPPIPQKTPAIITSSSSLECELEPNQLEYASLDLHHGGSHSTVGGGHNNPSPTRKTPSPRPQSSCSVGGESIQTASIGSSSLAPKLLCSQLSSPAPSVVVNNDDGVVYAQIDAARSSATAAVPSRHY